MINVIDKHHSIVFLRFGKDSRNSVVTFGAPIKIIGQLFETLAKLRSCPGLHVLKDVSST